MSDNSRDHSSPAIRIEYDPAPADPVRSLENRMDAHHRDNTAALELIAAALVRIEKRLENNALGFEDVNARIDRHEINELELRRQLVLLQKPSKKVKRK